MSNLPLVYNPNYHITGWKTDHRFPMPKYQLLHQLLFFTFSPFRCIWALRLFLVLNLLDLLLIFDLFLLLFLLHIFHFIGGLLFAIHFLLASLP